MSAKYSSKRRYQGHAVVEFMSVLPIMFLLFFMTAELGRALHNYHTLSKLVRGGVRLAVENLTLNANASSLPLDLVDSAKNMVVYGTTLVEDEPQLDGLSKDSVSVQLIRINKEAYVKIQAEFQFIPFTSGIPAFGSEHPLNAGFTMHSSNTMRAL